VTHRASANTLITTTTHGHHPTRSEGAFTGVPSCHRRWWANPRTWAVARRCGLAHQRRWLGVDAPSLPGGLHPPRLLIRLGFRPGGCHHLQRMEPEGTVPAAFGGAVLLLPLLRVRALADVTAPVVEQQGVKGAGQGVILLAASQVVAMGHGLSVSKTTHSRIDQNLKLASLLRRTLEATRRLRVISSQFMASMGLASDL